MKSTFYFVDKLIILLKDVPKAIKSNEEAVYAKKLIQQIKQYSHTLQKLLENHKNTEYLKRLHNLYIGDAYLWAERVKEVFKKLNDLVVGLEEYAEKLLKILDSGHYAKWGDMVGNLAMRMVMIGLHDDEEIMKELRKQELVEINRLKLIISYQEHIAELLQ